MSADLVLSRLDKVKEKGRGRWVACCPSHEDRSPSLAVSEMDDGRVLLHCFAGCSADEVLGSIGLELSDLFPEPLAPLNGPGLKKARKPFSLSQAFDSVRFSALLIAQCAKVVANGEKLEKETEQALLASANQIELAWKACNV